MVGGGISAESYYGAFRGVPTLDPDLPNNEAERIIFRSMRVSEAQTALDPDRPNWKNDQLPYKRVGG